MIYKTFVNTYGRARNCGYKFNILFSVEKNPYRDEGCIRLILVAWWRHYDFSFPYKTKSEISFDIGARPLRCMKTYPWSKED